MTELCCARTLVRMGRRSGCCRRRWKYHRGWHEAGGAGTRGEAVTESPRGRGRPAERECSAPRGVAKRKIQGHAVVTVGVSVITLRGTPMRRGRVTTLTGTPTLNAKVVPAPELTRRRNEKLGKTLVHVTCLCIRHDEWVHQCDAGDADALRR